MKRSLTINLRISLELLEKLEKSTKEPEKKFNSVSEALRRYAELGMHVESFRTSIKDPEFLRSIDDLKKGNQIIEWVATLKENELEALQMAIQLEKDGRYVQRSLR